ncbi:MAG: mannitol dehydrogenase family protein [Pseudomonadota bacterium]
MDELTVNNAMVSDTQIDEEHKVIALSQANLALLSAGLNTPNYDRSNLSAGIVHIGLGNFHRAHQAWYLHRLMQAGQCHDWAIIGAGVRAPDAHQRERLKAQDYLTTLIELDPTGTSAEVIGSMIDYVPVADGNAPLIARMAAPDIRIVSLTVTEGGYYLEPANGGFDTNHPDIAHDVKNPNRPRTAFGAMVAALAIRRANGHGPFTCLSCDNLQGNGSILRRAVVGLAALQDAELAGWIEQTCSFPNSMVDCIVPATGPRELELAKSFGVLDRAPVTHENFRQWVIEDNFCAGRPAWDKVGAVFSDQVHAFEAMKLRVLNGGHQLIAIPGDLLHIDTIAGAMAHPAIKAFLRKTVSQEIAPNVAPVPGITPLAYLDMIDERFSNPEIIDTTRRVAFDGSSRQTGFIVPCIRDALEGGQPVEGLALMSAMWARYCQGTRENGSEIMANDPHAADLQQMAMRSKSEPRIWIEQTQYFGDLAQEARFSDAFVRWLTLIEEQGTAAALSAYTT